VKTKLRILLVEDNNADAELIAHELREGGYDFHLERIESEAELRRELENIPPDLILSDHGFPTFDGFKALEIVRDANPTLPFIFVSGSNEQGMVARMYDEGATDYVFKRDIKDLTPVVREALEPTVLPAEAEPAIAPPREVIRERPAAIAFARLRLCPSCLLARDEHGVTVEFLDYFRSHNEIVVLHELCASCRPVARLS
jgi:CheY-like chemotaxis protein